MAAATAIADMCSGTGELSAALQATLQAPTTLTSLSDAAASSRKYLLQRFPAATTYADCRDQNIPDGAIVTIGAPCQDLSYAGTRAGAAPGSGTRSALIHDCIAAAISARASLIAAENVPGGYDTYRDLADHLNRTGYRATVTRGGAWEVGAPHRRQRIMLVATKRTWRLHPVAICRTAPPKGLLPTPTASAHTGPGRQGRSGGMNLQTWAATTETPPAPLLHTWRRVVRTPAPPHRDDRGRLCADFVEWMMGLPPAETLSRTARIRLAGNAVVGRQAALMLARGLEQLDAIDRKELS